MNSPVKNGADGPGVLAIVVVPPGDNAAFVFCHFNHSLLCNERGEGQQLTPLSLVSGVLLICSHTIISDPKEPAAEVRGGHQPAAARPLSHPPGGNSLLFLHGT